MQNAATEFETSKKPAVARARQRGIFSSVAFAYGRMRHTVRLAAWLCAGFEHPPTPRFKTGL